MNDPARRAFAFSTGRPSGHVFQTLSTRAQPSGQRYALWSEEVIRGFDMLPADEGQQSDFSGHIVSLADAAGEMHYVEADGYLMHRSSSVTRDELSLILMLEGQARVVYRDGATQRIEVGNFFLIDGARTSTLAWSRHVMIQVDLSRPLLEATLGRGVPDPAWVNAALAGSPLSAMLRGQLTQFPTLAARLSAAEQRALLDASESLAITTVAGALTALAGDAQGPEAGLYTVAQRIMLRQLDDPGLDVATIAHRLGCSRATLYRAFAAHGHGVAEYLRSLRLRKAYRLLQEASVHVAIGDLAARCGFIDAASFSRAFHRHFGVRPSDVRGGRGRPSNGPG